MEKLKLINTQSILQFISFGVFYFFVRLGMDYFSNQTIELVKLVTEVVLTMVIYGFLSLLIDFFSRKKVKDGNE